MRVSTTQLLEQAQRGGFAVGAFNVYTLEGVRAVTAAAEALQSPVILQVLPRALDLGGTPPIALGREACRTAAVPMALHLDHCASEEVIAAALDAGVSSVMADGSHLPYEANLVFTARIVERARRRGSAVEAELGRLSGSEDGLSVAAHQAGLEATRAYMHASGKRELVELMEAVIRAMQSQVMSKIRLFGSAGRTG